MNFISLEEALTSHHTIIARYGGMSGIRDKGLLISALEMPKTGALGEYLHPTIFDKAAAYLYHICLNHPFFDGNKRTAIVTALCFLEKNGLEINSAVEELEELVVNTAEKKVSKEQIVTFFQELDKRASV